MDCIFIREEDKPVKTQMEPLPRGNSIYISSDFRPKLPKCVERRHFWTMCYMLYFQSWWFTSPTPLPFEKQTFWWISGLTMLGRKPSSSRPPFLWKSSAAASSLWHHHVGNDSGTKSNCESCTYSIAKWHATTYYSLRAFVKSYETITWSIAMENILDNPLAGWPLE